MEAAGDVVSRAAPLPARRVLSAEDVALFHERGWLVVPNILSGEELEELRAHSRRLARQEVDLGGLGAHHRAATLTKEEELPSSAPESELDPAASASEDRHFRYFQFHRHMPLHEKYLLHPRILDCLEALIGADILALQSQLFLKPPGQPGPIDQCQNGPAAERTDRTHPIHRCGCETLRHKQGRSSQVHMQCSHRSP